MTHARLCEAVAAYLKTIPGCWHFRPVNTGYGRLGIPDIVGCYRGQMFAFECKVGRDRASPWQLREMAAIAASGGAALVVRELDDVVRVMGA